MKPSLKDKACSWLTQKKSGLGTVVVSAVYLVLLAALLIGATTAKYFEKRNVYTGFEGSKFNAVILGEYGKVIEEDTGNVLHSKSVALSEVNVAGKTVKAFGDTLDATSLQPGDTKDLWFSVSNGLYPQDKTTNNAADINEEYTIALRTTGLLPVNYKMLCVDSSDNTAELITGNPTRVVPTGGTESDYKWYEYRFYATEDDKTTGKEKTFTLTTNATTEGMDVNVHGFRFIWPIEKRNGMWTNDQRYMKEVDIIECYVTVKSLATTPDSGTNYNVDAQISTGSPKYGEDDVYHGTGLITLHNEGEAYNTKWEYRNYELDMRTISYAESGFVLRIDDGLQARRASVSGPISEVPKYTDYKIVLQVPVFDGSIKADSNKPQTQTTKDVEYKVLLPGEVDKISKISSSYFIYDIHDKDLVELTPKQQAALDACTTDTQALAFFNDKENSFDESRQYLYRNDEFIRPPEVIEETETVVDQDTGESTTVTRQSKEVFDYLKRNTNIEYEDEYVTPKVISEVFNHRDDIRIYAYDSDGKAVSDENIKYLAPSHKINVKVYFRFANDKVQS